MTAFKRSSYEYVDYLLLCFGSRLSFAPLSYFLLLALTVNEWHWIAEPGWDVRTDEGVIVKCNAMRVLFEQKLHSRIEEDLLNTVEALPFLDVILFLRKLTGENKSKYLAHVSKAFDEYEKIIFAVSTCDNTLIPLKIEQPIKPELNEVL